MTPSSVCVCVCAAVCVLHVILMGWLCSLTRACVLADVEEQLESEFALGQEKEAAFLPPPPHDWPEDGAILDLVE